MYQKFFLRAIFMALCINFYAAPVHCTFSQQSLLDLTTAFEKSSLIPIAIIGGGPAGLTAALYGGRAKMHTVVFMGHEPGGQLAGSADVQNWPGIEKTSGYDVMQRLEDQARHFGVQLVDQSISHVDFSCWPYALTTDEGSLVHALTVIIATGASPKILNVPGEQKFWGNGVSKCALCDGPLYEGKSVVVIGGGDSAVEEALQLAPYAAEVMLLVRSNRMRAAPTMQDKLAGYSNIKVMYHQEVLEVVGSQDGVQGVRLIDSTTGQESFKSAEGVFVAIGHNPNTNLFIDQLTLDARGYIHLAPYSQATSIRGVFAAGEVHDDTYRQACIAAGYGAMAALNAIDFLRDHDFNEQVQRHLSKRYYSPMKKDS